MDAQCSPCKIQIISEKATVTQTGKWEMDLLCKYAEEAQPAARLMQISD